MKFKVLTDKERDLLRKVETTVEQATQIIKRNQTGLDFIKTLPFTTKEIENYHLNNNNDLIVSRLIRLGCPHCDEKFSCEQCSWQIITGMNTSSFFPCCCAQFGGVNYSDIHNLEDVRIELAWDSIKIEVLYIPKRIKYMKKYREDIRLCKKFLKGHIEFAKGKINGEL